MDGIKGEDYFSWDFKVVTSSGEVADSLIDTIIISGYELVEKFQDKAFFKRRD